MSVSTAFKSFARLLSGPQPVNMISERLRDRRLRRSIKAGRLDFERPQTLAMGIDYSKRPILRALFPEHRFLFFPDGNTRRAMQVLVDHLKAKKLLTETLFVWSRRDAPYASELAGLNLKRMTIEDGFLRSSGLAVTGALPHSFCIDTSGLHFDATSPSDLETLILQTDSLTSDQQTRASECLARLISSGLSKYGVSDRQSLLPEGAVLVLGQVEDDASILANPRGIRTNEQLLQQAFTSHPDRVVMYRPHPDVAVGARPARSKPERLLSRDRIVPADVSITALLSQRPIVHTISSLGGFEALMRGLEVHCHGGPFYAGWGLTHDTLHFPRRSPGKSLTEIFHAAYLVYPTYFDPHSGKRRRFEETLAVLKEAGNQR